MFAMKIPCAFSIMQYLFCSMGEYLCTFFFLSMYSLCILESEDSHCLYAVKQKPVNERNRTRTHNIDNQLRSSHAHTFSLVARSEIAINTNEINEKSCHFVCSLAFGFCFHITDIPCFACAHAFAQDLLCSSKCGHSRPFIWLKRYFQWYSSIKNNGGWFSFFFFTSFFRDELKICLYSFVSVAVTAV